MPPKCVSLQTTFDRWQKGSNKILYTIPYHIVRHKANNQLKTTKKNGTPQLTDFVKSTHTKHFIYRLTDSPAAVLYFFFTFCSPFEEETRTTVSFQLYPHSEWKWKCRQFQSIFILLFYIARIVHSDVKNKCKMIILWALNCLTLIKIIEIFSLVFLSLSLSLAIWIE